MAYVISAHKKGDRTVTTRLQRTSAIVLATKLREEGCDSVAIAENGGPPVDLSEFKRLHRLHFQGIRGRRAP